MKKSLLVFAAMLLAAGAYAQTQRLNRTNTRTHDRSDVAVPTEQTNKTKPDRMNHENDMDRNNTNNNTNKATPNGTGTIQRNTSTGTSTGGTNTNGGTGTNGSNINTNNPR
jgi:hypothetical protein